MKLRANLTWWCLVVLVCPQNKISNNLSLEFRRGPLSLYLQHSVMFWLRDIRLSSFLIVGLEIWPPQLYPILSRALVCGADNNCVKPWDLNWLWLMNLLTWEFFTSFCLAPRLCKCWLHSPKSHWVSAWPSSSWSVSWPDPPLLLGAPHQAGPDRSKTRLRGFGAGASQSQGQAGLPGQLRSSGPT